MPDPTQSQSVRQYGEVEVNHRNIVQDALAPAFHIPITPGVFAWIKIPGDAPSCDSPP